MTTAEATQMLALLERIAEAIESIGERLDDTNKRLKNLESVSAAPLPRLETLPKTT